MQSARANVAAMMSGGIRVRPMSPRTHRALAEAGVKPYPFEAAQKVAAADAKRARRNAKRAREAAMMQKNGLVVRSHGDRGDRFMGYTDTLSWHREDYI